MEMFHDISLGLYYIHTYDPPIIHRDVKPSNILYRQGKFLLSDFGIAKTVDDSRSLVGTSSYMAPELWEGGAQTTKLDIWGLGATLIEAHDGFPDPASRQTGLLWHNYLQKRAKERPIESMLHLCPDKRPTAHEIVQRFFPGTLPAQKRRKSQKLGVPSRKRRSRSQSAGVSSLWQRRSRSKSARRK
jgi:serine/threonine protein kinase